MSINALPGTREIKIQVLARLPLQIRKDIKLATELASQIRIGKQKTFSILFMTSSHHISQQAGKWRCVMFANELRNTGERKTHFFT